MMKRRIQQIQYWPGNKLKESKYTFLKLAGIYQELIHDSSEWRAGWRQVSDWLLPGRGIFQTYSKPRKRKLTNPNVINNAAEEALYVFTSELAGRLTSPAMPWFSLDWVDSTLKDIDPLKNWLQDCTDSLHRYLHVSNFYGVLDSFYNEYAGYANAVTYTGEDSRSSEAPFRFEVLTAGEYAFTVDPQARLDMFFRTIFMTEKNLYLRFPDTVSKELADRVKAKEAGVASSYVTVLECVFKESIGDKPYTRVFYETGFNGQRVNRGIKEPQEPLERKGFYEFPYQLARYSLIGSDTIGLGPGNRAIPHIKRLQEMEKTFLMVAHKGADPPVNVPSRMRGKTNLLPGGKNYYRNPNELVKSVYDVRQDYNGLLSGIERTEQMIKKIFYNDLFLTSNRDPNATPYKATEVNARENEKLVRLGPELTRLNHEFFQPLIERCFNICLRKNKFPVFPPEYVDIVAKSGGYKINLISPLATAQRGVALQGMQSFLGFVGQAAQFDQGALDKIDVDATVDEYADITGVPHRILREEAEVQKRRDIRNKAQAAEQQKQDAMEGQAMATELDAKKAQTMKDQAEAGATFLEGQQVGQEAGLF